MKKISILYLEDDELDVDLIRDKLTGGNLNHTLFHVQNKNDFKISLKTMKFDVILADFSLPDIDGYGILYMVRQINPDIPTIILSGTINEEIAIDTLKYGAVDYIFKSKLEKLIPSIESALIKGEKLKKKRRAENELILSEAKFRTIFNHFTEMVFVIDPYSQCILELNDQVEENLGYTRSDVLGKKINVIIDKRNHEFPESETLEQIYLQEKGEGKSEFTHKNGKVLEKNYRLKIIPWQDSRAWLMVVFT